jgi:hypothetical protein
MGRHPPFSLSLRLALLGGCLYCFSLTASAQSVREEYMPRQIFNAILLALLLFAAGCPPMNRAENFQPMTVRFEWRGNAGYVNSPSPEIHVSNVPPRTAFLQVRMRDQNNNRNHGGGTLVYNGNNVIPVGALGQYEGPHLSGGKVHTYMITVTALNATKSVILGEGSASRRYPE